MYLYCRSDPRFNPQLGQDCEPSGQGEPQERQIMTLQWRAGGKSSRVTSGNLA